jgi:hypothetical protein
MSFISTFIASVILAVIAALALLDAMMPPGEGSFGIAKMVPIILIVLVPVCFCLIWLPANLIVWFSLTCEQKGRTSDAKSFFAFSGILFMAALALSCYYLAPQWLHKVHFYYKVEDQFGQPISDATIYRHNDFTRSIDDTESESDARGLFKETCKPGESFTLNPRKEGYEIASLNTSGAYSEELRQKQKTVSGAHDLIIIKMWKLQGAEPLIDISKEYKLPFTNAPVVFDLIAGKVVSSGGDIKIRVNRPSGEVSEHNPQMWGIDFEVIGGGFIETSGKESAITFAAPESGYQPSGTFGNNNGTDGLDKSFFVESRNGKVFSKLYLSMGINNEPDGLMYITFRGVANTNSSRNWEATAPQ